MALGRGKDVRATVVGPLALLTGGQQLGGDHLPGRQRISLVVTQEHPDAIDQPAGMGVVHASGWLERQIEAASLVADVEIALQKHGATGRSDIKAMRPRRHLVDAITTVSTGNRRQFRALSTLRRQNSHFKVGKGQVLAGLERAVGEAHVLKYRTNNRCFANHSADGDANRLGIAHRAATIGVRPVAQRRPGR